MDDAQNTLHNFHQNNTEYEVVVIDLLYGIFRGMQQDSNASFLLPSELMVLAHNGKTLQDHLERLNEDCMTTTKIDFNADCIICPIFYTTRMNKEKTIAYNPAKHGEFGHWSCFVIDFRFQTISFFDSLNKFTPPQMRTCIEKFSKNLMMAISVIRNENLPMNQLEFVHRNLQQQEQNDCGVYACLIGELYLIGLEDKLEVLNLDQLQINTLRLNHLDMVLKNEYKLVRSFPGKNS